MTARRARTSSPTSNLAAQFGAAVAGIWRLFRRSSAPAFNQDKLRSQFAGIEHGLAGGDAAHAAQAVMQADSFLDGVMRTAGGQGTSFADRLRSLERRFEHTTYQAVWDAHKLRNVIAHEHPTVTAAQARAALAAFRRAASQLGAF